MQNFFRQNRNILIVALSVFIVSMTALMLFLNNGGQGGSELQTDVLQTGTVDTAAVETNYRNILEGGEDPFAVIKLDGHIVFTSANLESMTGFSADDLQGRLFFSLIDGNDLPTFFSAFGKVIETGKPETMIGPFGIVNIYGEYKTSMGSVYPVMEEGRVSKIGILIKDISEKLNSTDETDTEVVPAETDTPVIKKKPATTTIKKATSIKKTSEPAEPKETDPATTWKKPKTLRENDPSWITKGKLVMLPFNLLNLPLFPAHLLLAQM
jgi:PAS domain S-box-containing protein